MRYAILVSSLLAGCVSAPEPVQEMSFVTRAREEQQKLVDTIARAGVPDSHFQYSINRAASSYDYRLKEAARFSEIYEEAKGGRIAAIRRVGYFYQNGVEPIEKNLHVAFTWYELGASKDDPECIMKLGECYYFGLGVAKDEDRATGLLKRAASLGTKSPRFDANFFEPKTSYVAIGVREREQFVGSYSGGTAELVVTFECDPNGIASWQTGMREFNGMSVVAPSRDIYLQVVAAKIAFIQSANRMDLHVLYGQGSENEKYTKYLELLKATRAAKAELKRLVTRYGN
jgi:hypothetical protein